MARVRQILEDIEHGRSGYNAGCGCDVCRKANSEYLKEYRARKRAEKLAAAGAQVPPAVEQPPAEQPAPGERGPIEKALADDIERDDGEPKFLQAVALTVARSLDGAVRTFRHDLVSPLSARLLDVGDRLFPPAPEDPEESPAQQQARVLELIRNGGQGDGEAGAAGGA